MSQNRGLVKTNRLIGHCRTYPKSKEMIAQQVTKSQKEIHWVRSMIFSCWQFSRCFAHAMSRNGDGLAPVFINLPVPEPQLLHIKLQGHGVEARKISGAVNAARGRNGDLSITCLDPDECLAQNIDFANQKNRN